MELIKSSKGATILEISLALGVAAILGLFVFQVSGDVFKNIRLGQISTSRAQVVAMVRQKVSNMKDIRFSLSQPGNEQFKSCICGGGSDCSSGLSYPVTFFDLSANNTPLTMFYNAEGNACDKTHANCLFEVKIKFIAQCLPVMPSSNPTPPVSCGGAPAELVGITYSVGPNPLVVNLNDSYLSRKVSGSVLHQVAEINAPGSGACP